MGGPGEYWRGGQCGEVLALGGDNEKKERVGEGVFG